MTCSKCHGRIEAHDIDHNKRICERLGKPYEGPPKVCTECILLTIMSWDDDGNEASETGSEEPTDDVWTEEDQRRANEREKEIAELLTPPNESDATE